MGKFAVIQWEDVVGKDGQVIVKDGSNFVEIDLSGVPDCEGFAKAFAVLEDPEAGGEIKKMLGIEDEPTDFAKVADLLDRKLDERLAPLMELMQKLADAPRPRPSPSNPKLIEKNAVARSGGPVGEEFAKAGKEVDPATRRRADEVAKAIVGRDGATLDEALEVMGRRVKAGALSRTDEDLRQELLAVRAEIGGPRTPMHVGPPPGLAEQPVPMPA